MVVGCREAGALLCPLQVSEVVEEEEEQLHEAEMLAHGGSLEFDDGVHAESLPSAQSVRRRRSMQVCQ